jgi:type IV secretory pathway TrbF-like protein
MNEMFRRQDQAPLPPGDVVRAGHEDWNQRINRAISGETAWKRTAWICLAMLTASGAANVWQGQQTKVQVVHVVHDTVGAIITVQPEGTGQFKPSPAQIAAELRAWVTNVRTVGVDVNAMRRAIPAAYNLVAPGSQAATMLTQFFQGNDPFKRATLETVNISDAVAIPPPPATLGKDDLQTWRVQWVETVVSRDGIVRSVNNQVLTVTFTVTIPKSQEEAMVDPDGLHIISFSWTRA